MQNHYNGGEDKEQYDIFGENKERVIYIYILCGLMGRGRFFMFFIIAMVLGFFLFFGVGTSMFLLFMVFGDAVIDFFSDMLKGHFRDERLDRAA